MSHIGEGELHAWLDGALEQLGDGRAAEVREHLRSCAACREALVAEEEVRARAVEVLALAAPRAADAPPFELLVERARGRDAALPARRMSRVARLGWAASVVVALGAGWTARELGLRPPVSPAGAERDMSARGEVDGRQRAVASPPSLEQTSPTYAAGNGDLAARDAGSGPVAPPPTVVENGAGGRVAAGVQPVSFGQVDAAARPAEAMATERRSVDQVEALADRAPDRVAAAPAREEALAPSDVRAPAAVAPASAEPPRSASSAPVASTGGAARAEAQRREAPRANQRALTAAPASGVGLQQPGRDSVAGVPPLFTARAEAGAVSGIADADEALDLIVPGLEVLYVEWSQVAPGQPMRRVLQRLASGDTLDIRFVRSVPSSAVADPLARLVSAAPLPGWSEVIKVHRDGWLVARAPVTQDELEALVAQAGTR